jgi:hypothetical protein
MFRGTGNATGIVMGRGSRDWILHSFAEGGEEGLVMRERGEVVCVM